MRNRALLLTALVGTGLLLATGAQAQTTERVSVASDGTQADSVSFLPAISANGRFVAFDSQGLGTSGSEVFVHDRDTGTTDLVSVASDGTPANRGSSNPAISADGRFVVFGSRADNLVPSDTNLMLNIFVHDRDTGVTERVSVASDGAEINDDSFDSDISADGRFVAFWSGADNLVVGDNNNQRDVFVHDRDTGLTERVSVASDGTEGNGTSNVPAISANGRFVAFYSLADNLVVGDNNGEFDIFVHDRDTGITERVSVNSDGIEASGGRSIVPAISADGRFVAFWSEADNLVVGDTNGWADIFVHDRDTGVTERVSVASDGRQGSNDSTEPAITADGRFVAFTSLAPNLVVGDTNGREDIFVHDRDTGLTERVSVATDGAQGSANSRRATISDDGRHVAFESFASNLVVSDTNGATDIFVHDRAFAGLPLQLSISGTCPGSVSVNLTNAALNGSVAFGSAAGEGSFTLPSHPCIGTVLGLANLKLLGVFKADITGTISQEENVGVDACGLFVQALDLTTCAPSNVASVP